MLAEKSVLRHREPWKLFGIKATVLVTLILVLGALFISRYRIGIDPQDVKCIPGVTFYLVDLKDKVVQRDRIYVFKSKDVQPFFKDGTLMVKYVRGMPGDEIEIRSDQVITINGKEKGWGVSLAMYLNQPVDNFMGKTTLQSDEFWFMGLSDISFDSRYWGSVSNEQIIGRAYPIF